MRASLGTLLLVLVLAALAQVAWPLRDTLAARWPATRPALDLACEQLAKAVKLPGTLSYGQLKLLPFWDALRGDPRFEKIVASLAPK